MPFGPILVYPRAARTRLEIVFWLYLGVGAGFQILDNQQVACGLKIGAALIWRQNPDFESGSNSLPIGSLTAEDQTQRIAALLHCPEKREFAGGNVLFIHTGGNEALFY